MANFAKLGIGNKVLQVVSVNDDIATTEKEGVDFLNNLYKTNDIWKQTFKDGTRKNYASVGCKYNETLNAFIRPKPFDSWTLNEDTCQWEAPKEKPNDGNSYLWNETNQEWEIN
tara:strand:- start:46 stop:387 length:342 start_codon:yes stop_codon:yes gene_type:complete